MGGNLYIHRELEDYANGLDYEVDIPGGISLVSSYADLNAVDEAVLMEHGNGQTYEGVDSGSYANSSRGKEKVVMYLAVNEHSAEAFKKHNPNTLTRVMGCPKLDDYMGLKSGDKVAISFHWDCQVCPETMSAFWHYRDILGPLSEEFDLIAHGHPRIIDFLRPYYEQYNIPIVEDFKDVIKQASVYICDNSSTIYEFAACGGDVVVLNTPMYRKHIEHGIRFWEYADIGIQVETHQELIMAVYEAKQRDMKKRKEEIVEKVYPNLGYASQEAAKWLSRL